MKTRSRALTIRSPDYDALLNRVAALVDEARCASARTVNALMTATYWSVGRHIVEFGRRENPEPSTAKRWSINSQPI